MAGDLIIRFLGDTREFNAKLAETQGKLGQLSGQSKSTGSALTQNLGVIGLAAVAAVGVASVHLAEKFDAAHIRLEQAATNVGQNFEDFKGKVGDVTDKMADLGFNAIDVESSLGSLTIATKDVGKATQLMGVAADLARFSHISLADATSQIIKVEQGRFKGLVGLGIQTSDLKGRTDAVKIAMQRLSDAVKGQAAAATETLSGRWEVLQAKLTNAGIAIGEALIPKIESLVDGISKVVGWIVNINDATDGWVGKLAGLTAAILIANAAMDALIAKTAGIALIGPALATLGPVAVAVAAAAGALKLLGAATARAGDSAETTDKFAASLRNLAHTGVDDFLNNKLGFAFKKLADAIKSFKEEQDFSGVAGGIKHLGDAVLNFTGNTTSSEVAINNTQKALLALYKTDPKDALEAFSRIKTALLDQGLSAKDVDKAFKKFTETTSALGPALAPVTEEQKKQADAALQSAQAIKAHQDALTKLGATAGPAIKKLADAMHLSDDAIKTLTTNIDNVKKSTETAFDIAGNAVQQFVNKSKVSFDEFAKAQFKQLVATINWSNNMKILAEKGINLGLLRTLEKAGPASAALVQSIVDHIKDGSITTLNNLQATADAERGTLNSSLSAAETEAVTHFGAITNAAARIPRFIPITITISTVGAVLALETLAAKEQNVLALAQRLAIAGIHPGFAEGGWVPGSPGRPVPSIVHGGEYVVSREELAGHPRADSPFRRQLAQGATARGVGGGGTIVLKIESHIDPINGRVIYKLVQQDQALNGPWKIKLQ